MKEFGMIHLVTTEDREPIAAFSKENYADEFINLYSGETFKKEELFVDAARRYSVSNDMGLYIIHISKDGEPTIDKVERTFYNVSCIGMISFSTDIMITNIWAKDIDNATNIAKEIRNDVIEKGKWSLDHEL